MVSNVDYGLLATTLLLIGSAFKNGKSTCKRFIFNTYVYIAFMVLWVYTINRNMSLTNPIFHSGLSMFGIFLLTLGTMIFMQTVSSEDIVLKHILFLAWLTLFSFFTLPLNRYLQILDAAELTTLLTTFFGIVIAASAFSLMYPNFVKGFGYPLLLALFGLILFQVIALFMGQKSSSSLRLGLSYVGIAIFTMFISYDTNRAIEASKVCVEGKADYINYATSFFLDFVNLLSNLVFLRRR